MLKPPCISNNYDIINTDEVGFNSWLVEPSSCGVTNKSELKFHVRIIMVGATPLLYIACKFNSFACQLKFNALISILKFVPINYS